MQIDSKQIAIYIGMMLVCSTYTLTASFYPKVVQKKGMSILLIGIMVSLNPLANLISSVILGKYMNAIGRKNVLIGCFVTTAASLVVLCPLEICNLTQAIIISIFSRVFGGIGAGCAFTAVITIFVSDYPDRTQIMISRMEIASGIGYILGPLIGSALFLLNLFIALLVVGILIFIYCPVA